MGKYTPVKVNTRQYKQLRKEGGMEIFTRIDKEGQHWAKAAISSGARLMRLYGIN